MRTKILIILIGLVIFRSTISCKEINTNKIAIDNGDNIPNEKEKEPIKFIINFPDTVKLGKPYNGKIKYHSVLDTIITTFGNKEKNRYTRFIMSISNRNDYDNDYLKKEVVKDTFGAVDNRTIPFYNLTFDHKGKYYIVGIINDIVIIDLHQKDKDGDDLARFIENEVRVTRQVYVMDSISPRN